MKEEEGVEKERGGGRQKGIEKEREGGEKGKKRERATKQTDKRTVRQT